MKESPVLAFPGQLQGAHQERGDIEVIDDIVDAGEDLEPGIPTSPEGLPAFVRSRISKEDYWLASTIEYTFVVEIAAVSAQMGVHLDWKDYRPELEQAIGRAFRSANLDTVLLLEALLTGRRPVQIALDDFQSLCSRFPNEIRQGYLDLVIALMKSEGELSFKEAVAKMEEKTGISVDWSDPVLRMRVKKELIGYIVSGLDGYREALQDVSGISLEEDEYKKAVQQEYLNYLSAGRFEDLSKKIESTGITFDCPRERKQQEIELRLNSVFLREQEKEGYRSLFANIDTFLPEFSKSGLVQELFWKLTRFMDSTHFLCAARVLNELGYLSLVIDDVKRGSVNALLVNAIACKKQEDVAQIQALFSVELDRDDPSYTEAMKVVVISFLNDRSGQPELERLKEGGYYTAAVAAAVVPEANAFYEDPSGTWFMEEFRSLLMLGILPRKEHYKLLKRECEKDLFTYFLDPSPINFRLDTWVVECRPIWKFVGYEPDWQEHKMDIENWAIMNLRKGDWRAILRFEQQTGHNCFSTPRESYKEALGSFLKQVTFQDRREFITFGLFDRIGIMAQSAYVDFYREKPDEFQRLVTETGRTSESLVGDALQRWFAEGIASAWEYPLRPSTYKEFDQRVFQVKDALFDPDLSCYAEARKKYTANFYIQKFLSLDGHEEEVNPLYGQNPHSPEVVHLMWSELLRQASTGVSKGHPMLIQVILTAHAKGHRRPDLSAEPYREYFKKAFLYGFSEDLEKAQRAITLLTPSERVCLTEAFRANQATIRDLYEIFPTETRDSSRWLRIYAITGIGPEPARIRHREWFAEFLVKEDSLDQTSSGQSFFEFGKSHGFTLFTQETLFRLAKVSQERPEYVFALFRDELEKGETAHIVYLRENGSPVLLAQLAVQQAKANPDSPMAALLKKWAQRSAVVNSVNNEATNTFIDSVSTLFGDSPETRKEWTSKEVATLPQDCIRQAFSKVRTATEYLERMELVGMPHLSNPEHLQKWQRIVIETIYSESLAQTEVFLKATDPGDRFPRVPQETTPNFVQFVYNLIREGNLNAVLEAERLLKVKIITKELIRGLGTTHHDVDRYVSLLGPLRDLIPEQEMGIVLSAARSVAASAFHRGFYKMLYPLIELIPNPFDSATLRKVLVNCRLRDEAGVLSEELKKILEYYHEDTELKPSDYGLLDTQHSMRTIAKIYQERLPKDGRERALALQALYSVDPRYQYISDLLAIQSPTRREQFCPYVSQVDHLLQNMYYRGIELDHPVYRKGLVEYFRAFGLHNLPILAQTVIEALACDDRRPEIAAENLERTDSIFVRQARQLLQIKSGCTPKEFIAEMKLFQTRLQETLLGDGALPVGLEHSPLGMELFNALIPNTGSYHIKDDRPSLITETRTLMERFPVPTFLRQQEVNVIARMNEDLIDKEVEDRVMDLNRQKNEKLREEPLVTFLAPWNEALKLMGAPETIVQFESWWVARVRTRLERESAQLQEKAERIVNQKGREAVQKQVIALERLVLRASQIEERLRTDEEDSGFGRAFLEKVLRALQELCTDETGKVDTRELVSIAKEEVYALFVGLMREYAPTHIESVLRPIIPAGLPISAVEQVRTENWIKYFYEEYLEHFSRVHQVIDLDEEDLEKAVQTERQIPEDLEPLMHRLWRTRGTAEIFREAGYDKDKKVPDHPIVNVARAIQALQRKSEALLQGTEEKEYTPLKISPCHGMARVLSGDIADACFHQHRVDLARGKFPGITALVFSLPGKDRELAGSALCIDTKNEVGERVLVLRALNPTEAVVQRDIEAESVVKAVTDYLIQAAQTSRKTEPARPVKEVRVCIGLRGGHSTNRQSIHVAEERLLVGAWKQFESEKKLVSDDATTFNGYNIWQSGSTVCVWRAPEESIA